MIVSEKRMFSSIFHNFAWKRLTKGSKFLGGFKFWPYNAYAYNDELSLKG